MATHEKKIAFGWVGGFTIVFVLLLFILAQYTLFRFEEMYTDLKEITEKEMTLTEIVSNVEQQQLKQHLFLEKIFRVGDSVREGAEGELLVIKADFEKYGNQVSNGLKRGMEIVEAAQAASAEASGKYMYIYNLLSGLQNERQKFENDAGDLIALIRAQKFPDAQKHFDEIEDDVNKVTKHTDLILIKLEEFMRESVKAIEAHASSATRMTRILAIVESLVAIAFAISMLFFIFRYITELKKTEEELRKHRFQLEELVEERTAELRKTNEQLIEVKEAFAELYYDAPVGYHELDKQGNIVRVNQTEAQLLGYSTEEMIGRPIFEFVSPEDRQKSEEAVSAKLAGEVPIKPFEREYIRKDGSTFQAYIEEKLITDDKSQIIGMRSTLQDITERKRMEEEVNQLKEAYEELYDNAPVGYHELDKQGNIVRVNQTEAQLLGYSTEEMIGRPIFEFVSQEDRQKSKEAVHAKLAGEVPIKPFERWYMRKDGTVFLAYIEEKLLTDENDQIVGIRSTLQDVTWRKQAK